MKARNLLWITVVNIFLLLLVSVLMEYYALSGRFKQLESTVSTALETAIRTSTASEEMFSEKYKMAETSSKGVGVNNKSGDKIAPSTLKVLSKDGGSWVEGKTYVMAKYYQENSKFPETQLVYTSYESSNSTDEVIYKWLFGGTGSAYYCYDWANQYKSKLWFNDEVALTYKTKLDSNLNASREPTTNFKAFYDSIGNEITSNTYIKKRSGDSFDVVPKGIPTLTQMGLTLNDTYNGTTLGGSDYTSDFLSSVTHFGKSANGLADTTYYLTPYSLGVTYVPTEVLKPAFLSHIEQLIRFNKVKKTVTNTGSLSDFASANGCIDTEVYAGGGGISQHHVDTSVDTSKNSRVLLNDGQVEYDLSTAKVKVDYFTVDFYDTKNAIIANRLEGAIPYENDLTKLPKALENKDTSKDKFGKRIVAKVTVKLKVHVPYQSSILQWFRELTDKDGNNHYDIRLWDEDANDVDRASNGVWFSYTTYTAISR